MECKTVRTTNNGCIIKYYGEHQFEYYVKKNNIIFKFEEKITITSKRENGEWKLDELACEDVQNPLHGVMSLLGTVRMITFYNIDKAWRHFNQTKEDAYKQADSIEDTEVPNNDSELTKIEMGNSRNSSMESLSYMNMPESFSNDSLDSYEGSYYLQTS